MRPVDQALDEVLVERPLLGVGWEDARAPRLDEELLAVDDDALAAQHEPRGRRRQRAVRKGVEQVLAMR